jgi:hypothetical protein
MSAQNSLDSGVNGETVEACPHCDSVTFQVRQPGSLNSQIDASEPKYYCGDCQTGFEESVTRPAQDTRDLHGLALFLFDCPADADLDELADLYDEWGGSE